MEIVSNEPADVEYAKRVSKEREVRISPPGFEFLADNVITENKIFIFSLDHMFAISIESSDLARTYQSLIKLAWQSAIKIKDLGGDSSSVVGQTNAGLTKSL